MPDKRTYFKIAFLSNKKDAYGLGIYAVY